VVWVREVARRLRFFNGTERAKWCDLRHSISQLVIRHVSQKQLSLLRLHFQSRSPAVSAPAPALWTLKRNFSLNGEHSDFNMGI
jgi:hypothetical protein